MPTPKGPNRFDLFDLAITELDRSIYKPNILSYRPYGAQVDFHKSDCFGRILTAGNRAGKTDAMVVEFIWIATNTHPDWPRPENWGSGPLQLRMIVVDVTKGVELIMLPKFKRWMTPSMLVDGSWDKSWDKNNLILTFSNGTTIDFLTYGMTLEKQGGVPRHLIGFDEEPPRDIFNEAMMRLMDFDGRWIIAATPINGMEWIYDLLVEPAQNGGLVDVVEVFELDASQNPYLLTEERDKFMIGMDKEERQIREEGKYIARGGLVFPRFKDNIEKYVLPEAPDIVKMVRDGWAIYATVDHGWNNPTAWLWIAVNYVGECIVFAEHYQSEMNISRHAAIVLEREAGWGLKEEQVQRSGDPAMKQHTGATGMTMIDTYAQHGVYIGVEGIPRDVMPGIEKLQQYLSLESGMPKLRISPNCPHLIRELKKLRWETYESSKVAYSKNKQETIHKKDDHACDALRYWATQMPDLTPQIEENGSKTPTTIGYTELIAKMRDDETVTFAADDTDEWEITESFGDYYEEGSYA